MPVPSKFASAGEKVYDKPELLDLIIDFLLPTKNKCESLNEGRGKDRSALQSSGQQGLEAASRSIYKETDYCMAVHILSKRVHGDLYLSCIRHITYQRECDIGLNSCGPYFIHAHERLTPADIRHVAPLCPYIIDLKDTHELRVGPCRGDCCDPVDEIIQHTFTGSSRTSHRRVMYPVKLDLAQLTPSVFEYPFWEYLNDINNSWADQITEFVIDLRIMAAPKDNTPVEPMLQLLRENMDDRVVVLDYGRQGVKAIHLAEIIAMLQVKLDSPSSALVERVSSFRLFPITTLGIESVLHLSGTKLHTLELGHECQLPRLTSAEHAELPHRFTLPHLARRIRQLSPNLTGLCLPMASYCNRYAEESTVLKALEALRKPGIPILGGTLQSIYLCLYSYAAAHENASGNHEAPISQDSCSPFAIALCLAYLAGPGCSIFIETRSWGSSCDCDKPRHIEAAVRFIHRLPASTLSILARISLDDIFQVEIEPVERDDLDHFPWRAPFPEAQWQQAVDRLIQKATRRAREPRRIKREAKEQAKTMMRAEKKNQKKEYRKAHKAEQAQKAKQG